MVIPSASSEKATMVTKRRVTCFKLDGTTWNAIGQLQFEEPIVVKDGELCRFWTL